MKNQVSPVSVWSLCAPFKGAIARRQWPSGSAETICQKVGKPCLWIEYPAHKRLRTIRVSGTIHSKANRFGFPTRTLVALILLMTTSLVSRAQSTNAPASLDYQSFKIITERNIFDPNRSSRSAGVRPQTKPTRVESLALVGTMSYEKGTYAFFDGTDSSYRNALKTGDSIVGYKIAEISADHVKLETNGKQIELNVGMQMKKQDEGEWQLGGSAESFSSSSPVTASAGNAAGGSTSEASDILKKLMQKREQELK
jgi:hypothetical protein